MKIIQTLKTQKKKKIKLLKMKKYIVKKFSKEMKLNK